MVVAIDEKLAHTILRGISWDTFEKIMSEIGESHYRVTYNDGELEFMTLSFKHERWGSWIGTLVFFLAMEFRLPICQGGSTTLKQSLRRKGLEPDKCYWIQHEVQIRDVEDWNALTDPPPDLAVEIDITSSWLDRLDIYAALKVPEVWRFNGEMLKVLVLGTNEKYRLKTKSLAFPYLPMDRFAEFVLKLGEKDEGALVQEFITWLRSDVIAKPRTKNGK